MFWFFVDFFLVLRLTCYWVWSVSVSNAYKSNVTTYRWKRLEHETSTMSSLKKKKSLYLKDMGRKLAANLHSPGNWACPSIYRVPEQAVLYSIFWLVSETKNCKECVHQHTWFWNQKGILMKTDSNHLWKKDLSSFSANRYLAKSYYCWK